mgnify:CR=1 FL=1
MRSQRSFRLESPAKINLGLRIVGRRNDGYHLLDTIFQEISLSDVLFFEIREDAGFTLDTNYPDLPTDDSNLVIQACHALNETFPRVDSVQISLEKHIPVGAGLGGGSSNAAATLLGLSKLFELPVTLENLHDLAGDLGADVPFFLHGGTMRGEGIGDRLTPVEPLFEGAILLVLPDLHISTAWAYNNIKYDLTTTPVKNKFKGFFDKWELSQQLRNDFEPLVTTRYSEIDDIRQQLMHLRADHACVSGSGSAVFGLFLDTAVARKAAAELTSVYRCEIVQPVFRSQSRFKTVMQR